MDIKVIHSIGIRCYTELILKRLNLIKCFNTNFIKYSHINISGDI
jgi:hypothetical protein